MSASILAVAETPLSARGRMTSVLDALMYGLTPPFSCSACVQSLADACPDCTDKLTAIAVVEAAGNAVRSAPTEAAALAAYTACVLGIVGAEVMGGGR